MYKVKTQQFEGPLHLLLELIEKQKLDITKISLAEVADDFLAYVDRKENVSLTNLSEFLLIASQMILIKSKALLPLFEFTQEEEEEIEDLEERLKEYRKFKKASQRLGELWDSPNISFARQEEKIKPIGFVNPHIKAKELKEIFEGILQEIPTKQELAEEVMEEVVSLEDKIKSLKKTLEQRSKITFNETFNKMADKVEIIVSFLAVLEMIKQQTIRVSQEKNFAKITMMEYNRKS